MKDAYVKLTQGILSGAIAGLMALPMLVELSRR